MRVFRVLCYVVVFFVLVFSVSCGGGGGSGGSSSGGGGSVSGNTYYVSVNGSDSNPGTRDLPWGTLGYASRQLNPGDTLVILEGRYILSDYNSDRICPNSGMDGAWITIRGEGNVVLAGRDNLAQAIDLSGVSYVVIENLEITSDNGALFRDGITATSLTQHIVLRDLYIHHIDEFGINIGDVRDLVIENCVISYCGFGAIGGPAAVSGGWQDVIIANCELSYSGHYYQGIFDNPQLPYSRPDGIGLEESDGPIELYNIRALHNLGDGIDLKVRHVVVHECIIANNRCDGLKLWGDMVRVENCLIYGRGDGDTTTTPWAAIVVDTREADSTFEFINVTVDDQVGNNYLLYVNYDNQNVPINLLMRNCIFSGRGPNCPIFIAGAVNFDIDHCLFYFPNSSNEVLIWGNNSYDSNSVLTIGDGLLYGDPLFIRTGFGDEGDYHLNAGSPAIDSGSSDLAPVIDLDGTPRPQGGGYDMGCYER